jgi:hypothetical protein
MLAHAVARVSKSNYYFKDDNILTRPVDLSDDEAFRELLDA